MGRRVVVVESIPARSRSVVQSKQLIVRRSPMEIERYAGASVAIPITIDHGFEQIQTSKPLPWPRMIIGLVAIFLFVYSLNFLFPRHTNWNLIMLYSNSLSTVQS